MTQIAIRLPDDLLAAVDKIIEDRHGQGGRTGVIRELLLDALASRGTRK